jgi:hypothetical protein
MLCSETGAFDAEAVSSLALAICKFQGQSLPFSVCFDAIKKSFCFGLEPPIYVGCNIKCRFYSWNIALRNSIPSFNLLFFSSIASRKLNF